MINGSNEKIKGGVSACFPLRQALVDANTTGSNLPVYNVVDSGMLVDSMLDTDVESIDAYRPLHGRPGEDTQDANCVIQFLGVVPGMGAQRSVFMNAAVVQRLFNAGGAAAVEAEIEARLGQ